jgi:hypothetical protein
MLLLLIALPWNPVVWVLRRRLQRAIELDCDTRVLSARVNARAYGALLLKVAQLELPKTGIFRVGAAFARISDLRARIEYMAKSREASSHGVGIGYLAGSVALFGFACAAPPPETVVQPRPSVSAPAAQRATMPDANASTMLRSQPGARPEVRAQRQHRAWGGQVSATLGMEEVDTGTTRSGSVAELRRNEAESRRARDSLFEVLHRLTQDRLAMAASVHDSAAALRARAEHELGDSSAIQKALQVTPLGVGIGTLWVLATPQGEVLRMAQSASISAADTITAERVAARLAATASAIRSFSVVNGSRLGLRGVRVVWAVANGRDVR